jgi:hypothetical protein
MARNSRSQKGTPTSGPRDPMLPQHRGALAKAKQLARSLLDDVHAIDFGYAYVGGEMTDRPSVRFHVAHKKPLSDLPPSRQLPDAIDGVEVDVLASGYMLHDGNPRSAQDVLQPGISVGNVKTKTTGTLGALVRDVATGEICILSNWHVLCGGPEAAVGDDISQPGPFDLGSNPARPIARLERWLRLSEQYDAAVARLLTGMQSAEQLFGTTSRPTGIGAAALGQRVMKSGAVSGITHAIVDGIGGTYRLDYTAYGDSPEWMSGFRLVANPERPSPSLSLEGDSGSLWVDEDGASAVGLHFGGEDDVGPSNDYALAHSIGDVLARLNLSLGGS